MSLELIIRPFQTRDVTPVNRPSAPGVAEGDPVVLSFGHEGEIKMMGASFSSNRTHYMEHKSVELNRQVTPKRIENPDDPDQFLMVELIDKLTAEANRGPNYQKTEYEFKNTEE